jgi:hypothetical protein
MMAHIAKLGALTEELVTIITGVYAHVGPALFVSTQATALRDILWIMLSLLHLCSTTDAITV